MENAKDANKDKERLQLVEKQVSEMKSLLLHKEQQASQKEQGYNEILQLCARYAKNDKALMQKLRDLKFKYSDGGFGNGSGENSNPSSPEEVKVNEASMATSIIQENQQLKKDLEFATSEIERLRSKLVFDDDSEMPPIHQDFFKSMSVTRDQKS